jgi:midasin (ATPase involved in ribosome maturation)
MNANGTFTFDVKKTYMKDFPFEYYLIVNDIKDLSNILVQVLGQYFEQK